MSIAHTIPLPSAAMAQGTSTWSCPKTPVNDTSRMIVTSKMNGAAKQRRVAILAAPSGEPLARSSRYSPPPAQSAAAAPTPAVRDAQQIYQASCVACHGAGIAGAPKVADKGQWAARIAKGLEALYASAVNGVQGSAGVMPAKGGNPALSDAEVKAAVDYMVGQSK